MYDTLNTFLYCCSIKIKKVPQQIRYCTSVFSFRNGEKYVYWCKMAMAAY